MLAGKNLGLITSRQMAESKVEPAFVSDSIIDLHSITSAVSISYLFPLYLYPSSNKDNLLMKIVIVFSQKRKFQILNPDLTAKLKETYSTDIYSRADFLLHLCSALLKYLSHKICRIFEN